MDSVFTKQQWKKNTAITEAEIKHLEQVVVNLKTLIKLDEKYELDYIRYKRYLDSARTIQSMLRTWESTFRDKDEVTIVKVF